MKSPCDIAAKWHAVQELANAGMLCNCTNLKSTSSSKDRDKIEHVIITLDHDPDCKIKDKMKELLGFADESKPSSN